MKEIEIKLPVPSPAGARRRLRELGFESATPRLLERNLILDTPERALLPAGRLLRLRSKGGKWWLTWKERPEVRGGHKVRHEIEIETDRGEALGQILGRLGYRPVLEYQKYRTEYLRREKRSARRRGKVLLDETPIGSFMELEGQPRWIDRVARKLGYKPQDYIVDSYVALYFAWCRQRGMAPADMVFERKGRRVRASSKKSLRRLAP